MSEHAIDDLSPRQRARIVKTAVTPRPIAWVSTRDADGNDNLAPFSSYNYVTSDPPVLLFNASRRDGDLKHSARNALDTGEFAVNVVTREHLGEMDHTSKNVPRGEGEFDLAGVERAPCRTIDAPRVADAPVTLECSLYDSHEIHDKVMVLGEVQYAHVDERVQTDGEIDMEKLDPVGRLGGPFYTGIDVIEFERQY